MTRPPQGILRFAPNRVWRTYPGGKLLDAMEGKASPTDGHFPEDWIGSVVEARNPGREAPGEGLSMVLTPEGYFQRFKDLVDAYGETLLGPGRSADDLPLVKYLDSATRLHFQVHPTTSFAQKRLSATRGKTEAYVILQARPEVEEPCIYAGFQRPPGRGQLKDWILAQDIASIEECFDSIPARPGDVFLIEGGSPHALGEGILMLEIMEASDLAARFEFERCGFVIPEEARFMGRDLDTALDVFDFEAKSPATFRLRPRQIRTWGSHGLQEELIGYSDTSCFRVCRARVKGSIRKREPSCFTAIVESGEGEARVGGRSYPLQQWDRLFCPQNLGTVEWVSAGGMSLIECYPRRKND